MGYDAPNSLLDPQVAQTSLAHQGGGALLAADVNGLNATHGPVSSHMTVMGGHSYGSTTVADAAAGYGMHTNDVILIGSPGTDMAKSAADFHLAPGGHVFVGAASTDPVTQLGAIPQVHIPGTGGVTASLGTDPAWTGSARRVSKPKSRAGPSMTTATTSSAAPSRCSAWPTSSPATATPLRSTV